MRRALPVLLVLAVIAAGAAAGVVRQTRADAELAAPALPVAPAAPAPAAEPAPAPATTPKQVFGHACGMCHSLKAAGAGGLIGPDLDAVRPSAAQVRRAIRTGSLDGVMRPNLLRGRQASAIAAYVARVARR